MAEFRKKPFKAGKARALAVLFLLTGLLLGVFNFPDYWNSFADSLAEKTGSAVFTKAKVPDAVFFPFRLGLDIQGGTHLVYEAEMSSISSAEQSGAMEAVRDVIERRVNLFGVAEPVVQVQRSGFDWRLIVELAGVKDVNQAINLIGATPFLEFKEELSEEEGNAILASKLPPMYESGVRVHAICGDFQTLVFFISEFGEDPCFISTGLTGRYLKNASVIFDDTLFQPQVSLELDSEGGRIFADLTRRNLHKRLAIYLDGTPISTPVVQAEITDGRAVITGNFSPQEAKELAGRMNAGALPIPITLVAQQTVEASLGMESLAKSLRAGLIGFMAVSLFMVLWYRFPGFLALLALVFYAVIVLAIFKLLSVTLTVAGIAGFILSIGMAVDANILIFERLKEELARGKSLADSVNEGFGRAWTSIRDSNVSSLITAGILYWQGTSVVQGFALTLGIGILVSMFSAIWVTRILLIAVTTRKLESIKFAFLSGIAK